MPVTDQFYGPNTMGVGRVVMDFGLCDLKGQYFYTAKARTKGFLIVVFYGLYAAPSVRALEAVQSWTTDLPAGKWSAVAVTDGDRDEVTGFVEQYKLDGLTFVLDHELYHTRRWGVSTIPSTYVVEGKTGRVLAKVVGDDPAALNNSKQTLSDLIAKAVAAEEAAKKAEEEKKAAEAAAKAAEASAPKPSEPAKT